MTLAESPNEQAYGVDEQTKSELQIPPPPTETELELHRSETKKVYQEILKARGRGRRHNSPLSTKTTDIESDEQTQATILITDRRTGSEQKIDPIFISVGWMTNGKEHSFETLVKNSRTNNSVGFLDAIPVIRNIVDDLYYTQEEVDLKKESETHDEPVIEIEPEIQPTIKPDPELAYGYTDPR